MCGLSLSYCSERVLWFRVFCGCCAVFSDACTMGVVVTSEENADRRSAGISHDV